MTSCYVGSHVHVNIPVTRNQCSTLEDMSVCCRAGVGPEPLLDIRSEPPPPHAGMSPSSCSGCFVSAARLHMFYCTLPICLSSNCENKQFDLQKRTLCLYISAYFNMEEDTLQPYGTGTWHSNTHKCFIKQNLPNLMIIRLWPIGVLCKQHNGKINKETTYIRLYPPHALPVVSYGHIPTCTYHLCFLPKSLNIINGWTHLEFIYDF